MKADPGSEQRFVADVDSSRFVAQDTETMLRALADWLAQLDAGLRAHGLVCEGWREGSAPVRLARAFDAAWHDGARAWSRQWASLEAARTLADTFDDQVLLLVFGKFNAGKSAFCNFLAGRFLAHGRAVRYFHLDAGRIVETAGPFAEGATETTARLQGVRLGEKLVLLDTPGLHSVTPENAALTRRFTDSADAVLWLTNSTSPGQVQELDELGRELHRNKPLLPVVTRSDRYEEDEVDGEIRKCLCNKTAQNRALQEDDIRARAQEKLVAMGVEAGLLNTPVSISVHMAREQGQTPAAMTEAGFERLYAALLAIVEPALAYKQRKRAEMGLHHLEENVVGLLRREVSPRLAALDAALRAAAGQLERQRAQLVDAVWRGVVPTLPARLDAHAATRDVGALCGDLSKSVFERFVREADEQLADYVFSPDAALAQIGLDDDARFEDVVVEHPERPGNPREVAGVDYGRLYGALEQAIHRTALRLADDAAAQCQASIARLRKRVAHLRDFLEAHEQNLLDLKRELRTASPLGAPVPVADDL